MHVKYLNCGICEHIYIQQELFLNPKLITLSYLGFAVVIAVNFSISILGCNTIHTAWEMASSIFKKHYICIICPEEFYIYKLAYPVSNCIGH
jgi:hypothetical protein